MLNASELAEERIVGAMGAEPLAPAKASLQTLVQSAIDDLRPHLQRDGGDIELIDVDGDMVIVDLKGTCVGCVLASVTLAGVRKRLIDAVGRPLRVVPVSAATMRRYVRAAQ
jgi:NifU-like protein